MKKVLIKLKNIIRPFLLKNKRILSIAFIVSAILCTALYGFYAINSQNSSGLTYDIKYSGRYSYSYDADILVVALKVTNNGTSHKSFRKDRIAMYTTAEYSYLDESPDKTFTIAGESNMLITYYFKLPLHGNPDKLDIYDGRQIISLNNIDELGTNELNINTVFFNYEETYCDNFVSPTPVLTIEPTKTPYMQSYEDIKSQMEAYLFGQEDLIENMLKGSDYFIQLPKNAKVSTMADVEEECYDEGYCESYVTECYVIEGGEILDNKEEDCSGYGFYYDMFSDNKLMSISNRFDLYINQFPTSLTNSLTSDDVVSEEVIEINGVSAQLTRITSQYNVEYIIKWQVEGDTYIYTSVSYEDDIVMRKLLESLDMNILRTIN